jgi:hypothetical protein
MFNWKTIKTFSTRIEAEIAKSFLEANGISALIRADDAGGLRPHLALTFGVQLEVEMKDVELAEKLLSPDSPIAIDDRE